MSLVEVIIALGVGSLIFLLVSGIYVLSQKIYLSTDAKAEISQNGRVIIDRLVREIRQSQKIITTMPIIADDTAPNEIKFQDGHDLTEIKYIRYYQDSDHNLNRQIIVYYFPAAPTAYVHIDATTPEEPHSPPTEMIVEDRLIGEFVDDIEFYGNRLININLYLSKNSEQAIISTAVFGRNL